MSDEMSKRITVRISSHLERHLREEVSLNSRTESDIVREALEAYFVSRPRRETCYDLARRLGIIGALKNAPPDMSTNPKYFRGFGRK